MRRASCLRMAHIAVDGFDAVRFYALHQGRRRSLIHRDYLGELAAAYLPAGMDRKDPRVSPLYADLRGFPPILIQVGPAETLLDDATRFAAAAGTADVAVTLEIWPHMIHARPVCNAHLEGGRRALTSVGTFIRQQLSKLP